MAVISPTLTITANASTATSNPGPLSIALSLSKSDTLTVGGSTFSGTAAVTTTHGDNFIYDGSSIGEAYIYLNNISDSTVYVTNADAGTDGNRFMTLRAGEFAFFPWSPSSGTNTDLYLDHSSGGTKDVEYWIFDIA
tara:strand:+ start:646 stop:1056 length:411 start_codon:yes stop_codon:yes gene_type:complete